MANLIVATNPELPRGIVRVMLRKQLQLMRSRLYADMTSEAHAGGQLAFERFARIESALARLNEGTFGRCVECGGPIALERLQASPDATRDADCEDDVYRRTRPGNHHARPEARGAR